MRRKGASAAALRRVVSLFLAIAISGLIAIIALNYLNQDTGVLSYLSDFLGARPTRG